MHPSSSSKSSASIRSATSTRPLRVYVLPVSGSLFVVQLGLLAALGSASDIIQSIALASGAQAPSIRESRPDIVLAASGGNLAAYTAMSADWSRAGIYSKSDFFHSDPFLSGWSDHVPSWVFLPFSRSVFRPGYGFEEFFSKLFSEGALASPQCAEIWTSTFHVKTAQNQFFVNKRGGETVLSFTPPPISDICHPRLGTDRDVVYAAGDRKLLAQAALASASIPWLVKPVTIGGEDYSDGGSMHASPLTILDTNLYDLSNRGTRALRLVYLSPVVLCEAREIASSIVGDIGNLLYSTYTSDVRAFINIILRLKGKTSKDGESELVPDQHHLKITPKELAGIIGELDLSGKHYALILFPVAIDGADTIHLANIRPSDVRRVAYRIENNFGAYIWEAPLSS